MTPEKIYDALYQRMDRLIKKYNPCKVYFNKEGNYCCVRDDHPSRINGCCTTCKNFNKGCNVQSLSCKMWICQEAFLSLPLSGQKKWLKVVQQINTIRLKHGIHLYFRSGKDTHFNSEKNEDYIFNDLRADWFIDGINIISFNEWSDRYKLFLEEGTLHITHKDLGLTQNHRHP